MLTKFENFLLEIDDDGIAMLTCHRPEYLNALNDSAYEEIFQFIRWANKAEDVKAIIITGAGEKAFVAGADIGELKEKNMKEVLTQNGQEAMNEVENCLKPVIAAVNGFALGGGCELAIACDFRIVSENAVFGMPECGLGILPGCGGTYRLARLVGLGRAKDMILLGRKIKGEESVQVGLATACVSRETLLDEAKKMALKLLAQGSLAIRAAKKILPAVMSGGAQEAMLMEMLAFSALCGTADKTEGISAFLEKRKADFKER